MILHIVKIYRFKIYNNTELKTDDAKWGKLSFVYNSQSILFLFVIFVLLIPLSNKWMLINFALEKDFQMYDKEGHGSIKVYEFRIGVE